MERDFYLLVKYYVVPTSCFVENDECAVSPAVPKDPDHLTAIMFLSQSPSTLSVLSQHTTTRPVARQTALI